MQRKLATPHLEKRNPVRLVEKDEPGAAVLIGLQIGFEELELRVGQVEAPRVVENREVGVLIVEAVVIRTACLLLVQVERLLGPDIVIAGRKVQRKVAVALPDGP